MTPEITYERGTYRHFFRMNDREAMVGVCLTIPLDVSEEEARATATKRLPAELERVMQEKKAKTIISQAHG